MTGTPTTTTRRSTSCGAPASRRSSSSQPDSSGILPDGTKFVSSVRQGTVARIRPGQKAESIASGIPSPASMCYDSKRRRLVIPMNDWNAITFVDVQ